MGGCLAHESRGRVFPAAGRSCPAAETNNGDAARSRPLRRTLFALAGRAPRLGGITVAKPSACAGRISRRSRGPQMGGSREEASCFECDSHRCLPRSRPRRRCERRRRPGDSDQGCDDHECRTGSAYADRKRDGRARDVHRERERVRHRSDVVVGTDVHGPVGQRQRRTHPYRCPRGRRTSVRASLRSVPEPGERDSEHQCDGAPGAADRRDVRQRAYVGERGG